MNKFSNIIVMLVACLVFGHQAQAQKKKNGLKGLLGVKVTTTQDKFEGTTTHTMEGNKVKIKGGVGNSIAKGALSIIARGNPLSIVTTRLQLENHIEKDGDSELSVILKVSVGGDSPFYPMAGESLIFLVDGERVGLVTEGEYNAERFVGRGNNSKVFARYPISREQLKSIIDAKEVEFRILQGHFMDGEAETRDKTDSSFEGSFSNKNFQAWKDFYQNYVIVGDTTQKTKP